MLKTTPMLQACNLASVCVCEKVCAFVCMDECMLIYNCSSTAIYNSAWHPPLVGTMHYRAPEAVLQVFLPLSKFIKLTYACAHTCTSANAVYVDTYSYLVRQVTRAYTNHITHTHTHKGWVVVPAGCLGDSVSGYGVAHGRPRL